MLVETKSNNIKQGKLLFVLVDCDVEDNKRVMEFFGITEENCPDMRVINMEKNMAKFAPEKSDLSGALFV